MKKTLIQAFHPQPERSRVQRAWLERLSHAPGLTINRLYERYPDWRIDIEREQQLLVSHERIVFMHPLYWYSVPPLMKLWMDEVLTFGWAYGPGVETLKGKDWLQALSTGASADDYQAGGFNEYSLSELMKPLQRTAAMLGMRYQALFVLDGVRQRDDEALRQSAERLLARLSGED
ncbi:NAD(P)H-dependent oxidoreductase [Paucibacter sp. APW11]|uniref:NAD(P)H-dependent oxidoreductase n=1 Tax=Roseateles aquae TaxID=3077235 RepID=A0ABU3P7V0_9BURK|nr:NAD(P)H-dependent oxidoreductase [Paucibacter sp. APW11]MDT8998644.1 NAD(P)H-dependent oxidoreductase [Paucibacter sp. APW11]